MSQPNGVVYSSSSKRKHAIAVFVQSSRKNCVMTHEYYRSVFLTITYQGIDFRNFSAQSNIGGKNLEFNSLRIKKIQLEEILKIVERFSIEELLANPAVPEELLVTVGSVTAKS